MSCFKNTFDMLTDISKMVAESDMDKQQKINILEQMKRLATMIRDDFKNHGSEISKMLRGDNTK